MQKSAHIALSAVLPALMIWSAACTVYDASLSQRHESRRRSSNSATPASDASFEGEDDDAGEESSAESCGDGIVAEGEQCDVAIAPGRAGACPEGCSGREGCTQRVLVGSRCTAHCAEVQITQPIPDDGCCPSEATAVQDVDCASVCGNGVIERGERCDPPENCAQKRACTTTEACQQAHYTGNPDQCTAACEIEPIHACVSDDGCCAPGCTPENDHDCTPADTACDAGCMTPTGEPSEAGNQPDGVIECQASHPGMACEACDCTNCQAEVLGCSALESERDRERCEALSQCSVRAKCAALDCYCGDLGAEACAVYAAGPCVSEIRAIAGSRNVFQLITISGMPDTGLGRWLKLAECRASKCAEPCGL